MDEHKDGYCDVCGYTHPIKCCASKRPNRKVFCQLEKGHKGSCQAVIFWEREKVTK